MIMMKSNAQINGTCSKPFSLSVRVAAWFRGEKFSRRVRHQAICDVEGCTKSSDRSSRKPWHPYICLYTAPEAVRGDWCSEPERCRKNVPVGSAMVWRSWTILWASTLYQDGLTSMGSQYPQHALWLAQPASKHHCPSQPTYRPCRLTSTICSNSLVDKPRVDAEWPIFQNVYQVGERCGFGTYHRGNDEDCVWYIGFVFFYFSGERLERIHGNAGVKDAHSISFVRKRPRYFARPV